MPETVHQALASPEARCAFGSREPLGQDALRSYSPPSYPRPSRLKTPIGVSGAKAQRGAQQLGLDDIGKLFEHLPRGEREVCGISELRIGEIATVVVEVRSINARSVRRRGMRPLVEAVVADADGQMRATFFNQPWLKDRYPKGTVLLLHGKYQASNRFSVQSHAIADEAPLQGAESFGVGDDHVEGEVVAHYPATDGLNSTQILTLVREHAAEMGNTVEPLPARIRTVERLPDRAASLYSAHFGDHEAGRRRLAFEELLFIELTLLRRRANQQTNFRAHRLASTQELTTRWLGSSLPFTPTADQQAAIGAIGEDLKKDRPMQRLLMGEVGSGKTVVALYTMLRAVEHDTQAVLMAPTETLAEQHFATLQRLMPGELVPAALLTGSTPAARRRTIHNQLATGELKLLVGTHAVIEDEVKFARLAVAVVDEQHRFGVEQRRALNRKARSYSEDFAPHVLHMTATPIPRTLALTAYGDLDTTVLRQLPAGRHPIATHVASSERERARAYERIREELRTGRQAFVVCPLVEESEALDARAVEAEYRRLKETEFADFAVVLLHGQMASKEKQQVMAEFASGRADVLVATTVIEVGIDVPNASVMLIENAERYGISQLHQLRGRIGRGPHQSLCLLFGPKGAPRLRAVAAHSDGFKLAEIDLELRGEGEVLGKRQSGLAQFRFARLPEDSDLLERARCWAVELLRLDPALKLPENVLLVDGIRSTFGGELFESIPA